MVLWLVSSLPVCTTMAVVGQPCHRISNPSASRCSAASWVSRSPKAMGSQSFYGNFGDFLRKKYGGFHTWGYPHSWMVFVRENPTKLDDLGYPHFRKPPNYGFQHETWWFIHQKSGNQSSNIGLFVSPSSIGISPEFGIFQHQVGVFKQQTEMNQDMYVFLPTNSNSHVAHVYIYIYIYMINRYNNSNRICSIL